MAVNKGVLSASGLVEYAPTIKVVDLEQATIRGVQVEYTHTPARKGVVQAATAKTVKAAREASNDPGLILRAKEMRVVDSTVGFVNKAVNPPYRVFIVPGQPDPEQLLEPARRRRHGGEARPASSWAAAMAR